jgi:hypothetical protein
MAHIVSATSQGQLIYNQVYPREQEYVIFTVDTQIMATIGELIEQWQNSPPYFAISLNDCVSFIYRVCDIIGLAYNPFARLPVSAIRSIRSHNDQTRIYRMADRPGKT